MFLGKDPYDISIEWKEWHLQAYVVMMARRDNYTVHGDQNGASKTPKGWSQASATGMLKGWPDLCFILPMGPLWIELKVGKGRLSKEQIELHVIMEKAGCVVHTVNADCPAECWYKVKWIITNCPTPPSLV